MGREGTIDPLAQPDDLPVVEGLLQPDPPDMEGEFRWYPRGPELTPEDMGLRSLTAEEEAALPSIEKVMRLTLEPPTIISSATERIRNLRLRGN
jgi:hypothetical protein